MRPTFNNALGGERWERLGEEQAGGFGLAMALLPRVDVLGGAAIADGYAGVAMHLGILDGEKGGIAAVEDLAEVMGGAEHLTPPFWVGVEPTDARVAKERTSRVGDDEVEARAEEVVEASLDGWNRGVLGRTEVVGDDVAPGVLKVLGDDAR